MSICGRCAITIRRRETEPRPGKEKPMKRILVVEDEASIRELVALNLKMTGWEVLEAPSAERALELIQEKCPPAM